MALSQNIVNCALVSSRVIIVIMLSLLIHTEGQKINEQENQSGITNDFLYHNPEDESLIENLRKKIYPPSSGLYNLKREQFDPSQGQARVVRKLTNYKTGGFFVECGGGNGEFFSNTLFLEEHLGWTGLLVEPDPENVKDTLKLNRKSWVAPFCMSLNTSAYKTFFEKNPWFTGKIIPKATRNSFQVRCYSFITFLLALNVTVIDYFSLDVEGHEIEVLETVPFDKVDISVLSVEFSKSRGQLMGVKNFMEDKGYRVVMEVPPDDLMFVKKTQPISDEEMLLF